MGESLGIFTTEFYSSATSFASGENLDKTILKPPLIELVDDLYSLSNLISKWGDVKGELYKQTEGVYEQREQQRIQSERSSVLGIQGMIEELQQCASDFRLRIQNSIVPENLKINHDVCRALQLAGEVFSLTVYLLINGGVFDVRYVLGRNAPESVKHFAAYLRDANFKEFRQCLKMLCDKYQPTYLEPGKCSSILECWTALEQDIHNLNTVLTHDTDLSDVVVAIQQGPLGYLITPEFGGLYEMTFFLNPLQVLDVKSGSQMTIKKSDPFPENLGVRVKIGMVHNSNPRKIQCRTMVKPVPPLEYANSFTPNHASILPLSFVLSFKKPFYICTHLVNELVRDCAFNFNENLVEEQLHVGLCKQNHLKFENQFFVSLPDFECAFKFNYSTVLHAVSVTAIPFCASVQLPNIVKHLRKQAIINCLLESCMRKQNVAAAKVFVIDLLAAERIRIFFSHPLTQNHAMAEIDIQDISRIFCSLSKKEHDPPICSNDYATAIIKKCFSIPHLMRCIVRKCKSKQPLSPVKKENLYVGGSEFQQPNICNLASPTIEDGSSPNIPPTLPNKSQPTNISNQPARGGKRRQRSRSITDDKKSSTYLESDQRQLHDKIHLLSRQLSNPSISPDKIEKLQEELRKIQSFVKSSSISKRSRGRKRGRPGIRSRVVSTSAPEDKHTDDSSSYDESSDEETRSRKRPKHKKKFKGFEAEVKTPTVIVLKKRQPNNSNSKTSSPDPRSTMSSTPTPTTPLEQPPPNVTAPSEQSLNNVKEQLAAAAVAAASSSVKTAPPGVFAPSRRPIALTPPQLQIEVPDEPSPPNSESQPSSISPKVKRSNFGLTAVVNKLYEKFDSGNSSNVISSQSGTSPSNALSTAKTEAPSSSTQSVSSTVTTSTSHLSGTSQHPALPTRLPGAPVVPPGHPTKARDHKMKKVKIKKPKEILANTMVTKKVKPSPPHLSFLGKPASSFKLSNFTIPKKKSSGDNSDSSTLTRSNSSECTPPSETASSADTPRSCPSTPQTETPTKKCLTPTNERSTPPEITSPEKKTPEKQRQVESIPATSISSMPPRYPYSQTTPRNIFRPSFRPFRPRYSTMVEPPAGPPHYRPRIPQHRGPRPQMISHPTPFPPRPPHVINYDSNRDTSIEDTPASPPHHERF